MDRVCDGRYPKYLHVLMTDSSRGRPALNMLGSLGSASTAGRHWHLITALGIYWLDKCICRQLLRDADIEIFSTIITGEEDQSVIHLKHETPFPLLSENRPMHTHLSASFSFWLCTCTRSVCLCARMYNCHVCMYLHVCTCNLICTNSYLPPSTHVLLAKTPHPTARKDIIPDSKEKPKAWKTMMTRSVFSWYTGWAESVGFSFLSTSDRQARNVDMWRALSLKHASKSREQPVHDNPDRV